MKNRTLVLILSALVICACEETNSQCDPETELCEPNGESECTNGTWACNDNTLSNCISGKWEIIQTCEENTQCDAQTGKCASGGNPQCDPETESCDPGDESECTDNTWKCDGKILSKCVSGKWEISQTCDENTQCNAETGKCEPGGESGCTDDTWSCDGKILSKCVSGKWEISQTCDENTQCNAETGKCEPGGESGCTDGTWSCDGKILSKCVSGNWEISQTCEGNTKCNAKTGSCQKDDGCTETEHFFANQCEADDLTHCGSHTNDCTKMSGWKSGDCISQACFAEECNPGYHLASLFENSIERTFCEEDTHDACGSINTHCTDEEICTQGKCQDKCQPGEVICDSSCINPTTSRNFCGADVSCSSYTPCSEFEDCISGKCVLSSCQNTEESICTENNQNICVNIHGSNPNHCGACGATCPDKETAKASGCNQGQCTYICNNDMVNCGTSTEPLCLTDEQLNSDAAHCGDCNTKCADNEFCQNGECIISSCTNNECLLDNACVNQNDHCGTQCINCNTANHASAGTCQAGSCTITSCAAGYHLNQGACEADSATACPNGKASGTVNCNTLDEYTKAGICVEAKCQATECKPNAHLKDGKCIADTAVKCGAEEVNCTTTDGWRTGDCVNGICTPTACTSGYCLNQISGQCTNEQSISACGIDGGACLSCNQKQVCEANTGQCVAKLCEGNVCNQTKESDETLVCKNDDTHCGSSCLNCNAFTPNEKTGTCSANGTCQVSTCEPDYHIYNNTCEVNSTTNCGEHGKQCNVANASNTCTNGTCAFTCNEGYVPSNNACVLSDNFITQWNVPANDLTVKFPTYGRNGNITIDWGDGKSQVVSGDYEDYIQHTYSSAKVYTITVTGQISAWTCRFDLCKNLVKVLSYGKDTSFGPMTFHNASKLVSLPTEGTPKFCNKEMIGVFYGASSFNQDINFWDTSNIKIMSGIFKGASSFNQPLDNWDTSNVTDISAAFYNAKSFNQPLNDWDTSNVTIMAQTFYGAESFNQPLDKWNTSKVTVMELMFYKAKVFNQSLNDWDTSNVTSMTNMFYGASKFDQPLNKWKMSKVSSISGMFQGAASFNQSLNDWDTSSVQFMDHIFMAAKNFNQPLNNWKTSKVKNMSYVFYNASSFNQPLDKWDTSNVTNMSQMFLGATSFNQPLNDWKTSNVTFFDLMFTGTPFDQPLDKWDTSSAKYMDYMFQDAKKFNQPLNDWNTSNVTSMASMFQRASSFNQPLDKWDTSKVENIQRMFREATAFNQDISGWNVAKVNIYPDAICSCGMSSDLMNKIKEEWMKQNQEIYWMNLGECVLP